ncbi:MAG TPA: DNA mismatch repair protein MutS, partial [Chitinophagaceae bacterium]|nr:DNA mismatch repair protein MutS [Chitinophagaceae bacterium]
MQIDKITFNDISVFHVEEEFSIFHKLNFTRTLGGKEWLRRFFMEPHSDRKRITGTQNVIRALLQRLEEWPTEITNGTVIMMDKFLDYNLDPIPASQNPVNALTYQVLHNADYSMLKYSVRHFADFFRGMKKMLHLLDGTDLPPQISFYMERIFKVLQEEPLMRLAYTAPDKKFSNQQNLYFGYHLRTRYRSECLELIDIYSRLDAWYSM